MSDATDLLELQAADIEIARANKRLDELPEKIAILQVRAKQREATSLADKARLLLRKLEGEVKARQDEDEMLQAKIAQEQEKVMATTDHRAVQSITREMDGLRRRRDKIEMEELQFMERAEKARAQVDAIEEHRAKLAEKEAALIERFREVGGTVQSEIAALTDRRAALAAALGSDALARYESVRDAKGGVGVGRLEGAMCSACRMDLPAERVKELVEGPDVGVCPQCRRIIVVRCEDA